MRTTLNSRLCHDCLITQRQRIFLLIFLPYLSLQFQTVCSFTTTSNTWHSTTTSSSATPIHHPTTPNVVRRWSSTPSTVSDSPKSGDSCSTTSLMADSIWTADKLLQFGRQKGVTITISTLGPGFRVVGRATPSSISTAATDHSEAFVTNVNDDNINSVNDNTEQEDEDSSILLGYVEGFVRGSILHLDKMQVFASKVDLAHRTCPDFDRTGGTIFGVGMLLGYLALLHGRDQKCRMAEFLAIDDEDFQHRRLVRYYKRGGFEIIKYVGEAWNDIPDRLVWGGCGTLMAKEVEALLILWTRILQRAEQSSSQS